MMNNSWFPQKKLIDLKETECSASFKMAQFQRPAKKWRFVVPMTFESLMSWYDITEGWFSEG